MYRRLLCGLLLICLFATDGDSFLFPKRKRDCVIKPWSGWKQCQKVGNSFVEVRARYISQARNGGKPCPPGTKVREERPCNGGQATSSFVRAAFGSIAFGMARTPLIGPASDSAGKTVTNSQGDTCRVLTHPTTGKIIGAGSCRSTRTKRSIKDYLASYFSRLRRQINEPHRDVLFLIDRSYSIRDANVQKTKDMAAAIVNLFCGAIELGNTRVGVATFNQGYERRIAFNRYPNQVQKEALMTAIRNLNFDASGSTHLGEALRISRLQTLTDRSWGARHGDPHVTKMIFLISDGCSNGGLTPSAEAPLLTKAGIETWVVQVNTDDSCKKKMLDLDGGNANCFTQFFYEDWAEFAQAAADLAAVPPCCLETWTDLNEADCQ